MSADPKSKVYGDPEPELTVSIDGLVGSDVISYEISREEGETVDDDGYTITVTGDADQGNYRVLFEPSVLIIEKRAITFTSASASKEYDSTPLIDKDVTIGGKGLAFDDTVTFNVTGTQTSEGYSKNTFTYVLDSADNYDVVTIEGTLTVTDVTGTVIIVADSATKRYDGVPLTFGTSYTDRGFVYAGDIPDGDRILVSFTQGSTITDVGSVSNVIDRIKVMRGDVDVTSSYSNVEFMTIDGTFTITKRNITIVSDSRTWTYDGSYHSENDVSFSTDGFVQGEGATYTYSSSIRDVGSTKNVFDYQLRSNTKASNYDIRISYGILTVVPMIVVVDVDDVSKTYGDSDPTFTAKLKDRSGRTLSNVDVIYDLTRVNGEDVGRYTITPTGPARQGNYQLEFHTGTLTIDRAGLTVTADDRSIAYGDAVPSFSATVEGLRFDDRASDIRYSISCIPGVDAGSYPISVTGDRYQGNYDITFVKGTLTVSKKVIPIPVAVNGLIYEGEPLTGVPAGYGYGIVGNVETNVGNYVANVTLLNQGYVWSDHTSVVKNIGWSIGKRTITVTTPSDSKTYDGTALRLYVNGVCTPATTEYTSIQPEHGVNAITVNDLSEYGGKVTVEFAGDRGLGVPQIAMLVGFSSLGHFNKIFKLKFGITPAAARRQRRIFTV